MESATNDLIGLGASAIAVVLILRLVFDFVTKMKGSKAKDSGEEVSNYVGFTETHAQCIAKIEYQVNEMYSGLQVNKELQRALADLIGMQEKQTSILKQLTELTASNQLLLSKIADKDNG